MSDSSKTNQQPTIYVQPTTNGIGIAGFICSIIALITGCIPFLGWFLWFLGLILSFIGIFIKPRGFAIAGLIISLIGIILLLFIFAGLGLGALTLQGADAIHSVSE